jgi:hypothetical protein
MTEDDDPHRSTDREIQGAGGVCGQSLISHISEWSHDKDHPVLWLQWEPLPSEQTKAAQISPEPGWCSGQLTSGPMAYTTAGD